MGSESARLEPRPEAAAGAAQAEAQGRAEVLDFARGGWLNVAGAAFNQAMRMVITLLLARLLGPDDAGLYFEAFAFLALLAIVASGGFVMALTRFVAVHRADGDRSALRGTVRVGLLTTTAAAAVLGAGLFAAAPWLATEAFGEERLATLLRFVALTLPPTVFTDAALSATQGFKTMRPYALINLFFEPAARVALTVGLLAVGWGLEGAMTALLVTNLFAALLAGAACKRLLGAPAGRARARLRELLSFSSAAWLSSLASAGLLWADTILLGLLGSPRDVGVYQVATRLTLLATIFIGPVGTSFAPRIADLHRRGRLDTLRRSYELATSWVMRLSLPAFVVLLVWPRELLSLFGPAFVGGAAVTIILAIGQLVNVATGPCGYMLTMSGRPQLQTVNNVTVLTLNIALNLWLIPRFGIVGAASAWASTIVLGNLARVAQVWWTMRMIGFERGSLKGVIAAAAAALLGVAVQAAVDGIGGLVVGASASCAVYVLVLGALGVGAEDRMLLTALRQRLRPS